MIYLISLCDECDDKSFNFNISTNDSIKYMILTIDGLDEIVDL